MNDIHTNESSEPDSATIKQICDALRNVKSVLFITGAGLSADSGLPTYRGIGGIYNQGLTEEGMPIEQALSGEVMASRPDIVWRHLMQVEQACRDASFNRGHEVIQEMEKYFERVCVLTQNIDGFHHAAGSKNVIDIHGGNQKLICTQCDYQRQISSFEGLDIPPPCPECNAGILRPDVVLFGEMLSETKLDRLYRELDQGFDVVFSIGTTSVFPYIAYPMQLAYQQNRTTIEINPSDTEVSHLAKYRLLSKAAKSLDEIWSTFH